MWVIAVSALFRDAILITRNIGDCANIDWIGLYNPFYREDFA